MAIYRGTGTPGQGDNYFTAVELEAAVTAAEAAEAAALASQTAAETAETNAAASEAAADADATATAADVVTTNADVVLTNADVVTTNADAVATAADVVTVTNLYDSFDDRYLGVKSSDPTLDNDGNALLAGTLYWKDTATIGMYVYSGSAWNIVPGLSNVVEDTTPQLGGDLDTNGNDIVTVSNADLNLLPHGTGRVVIDGTSLPEGTAAVLDGVVADASGNLIYAPIPPRPNLLVNGALEVWQRDTSYTAIAHAESWADNWAFNENGTVVGDMAQLALVDGNQQASWYGRYDVTTADAAMGILDYVNVTTHIEGHDFGQANWGTAAARDITVQFAHGHTKTGTYAILFSNGANDRTYAVEYTQSVADTWEYETLTIPGDTSGSWPVDETTGLRIMLSMAVGTLIDTATVDAWQAGGYWGTENQVNAVDNASNYLRMGPMKVEIGSEATPFQPVNFAIELKKCQRYWFKSYDYDTAPGTVAVAGAFRRYRVTGSAITGNETVQCIFGQHMRVTPTTTLYSSGTGTAGKIRDTVSASDVTANLPGTGNEHTADPWAVQGSSSTSLNFQVHVVADARMA